MLGDYSIKGGSYEKACYWINGERIDLATPVFGYSEIKSIFVDSDQIYAAGNYRNMLSNKTPCYWVNGKRIKLSTIGNVRYSCASYIKVINGNIYIHGWVYHHNYSRTYCYWVNSQRTDFIANKNEYPYDATFTINEMPVE